MKPFLIQEFNLDGYEIRQESIVWWSRPRIFVKNIKNHHLYLIKWYSKTRRELWVEQFASVLWKKITGIDVQDVSIKTLSEDVISELQAQSWSTNIFNVGILIQHAFPKWFENQHWFQILGLNPRDTTSMERVFNQMNRRYGFANLQDQLLQSYADMIVFDALIGNMDRHLENWGILENKDFRDPQMRLDPRNTLSSSVKFTPFFDHGSAWLFELSEEKVTTYLANIDNFRENYILWAKYSLLSAVNWAPKNVFSVLKDQYINKSWWKKYIKRAISKLDSLTDLDIAEVIFKIPNHTDLDYSKQRKELLFQSTRIRKNELYKIII